MANNTFGSIDGGLLSVSFRTADVVHIVDKYTGYFRKGSGPLYEALKAANAHAAELVQEAMRDTLRENIGHVSSSAFAGRPQRGGLRLEKAIMDHRNRNVFANGYVVGIEEWMDSSPAEKYWRRIEEGDTATFRGYIMFTNTASGGGYGGTTGPYSRPGDGGPHMRLSQFSRVGKGGRRGVWVEDIGPFPALEYVEGGRIKGVELDMFEIYSRYLNTQPGFPQLTKETLGDYFK